MSGPKEHLQDLPAEDLNETQECLRSNSEEPARGFDRSDDCDKPGDKSIPSLLVALAELRRLNQSDDNGRRATLNDQVEDAEGVGSWFQRTFEVHECVSPVENPKMTNFCQCGLGMTQHAASLSDIRPTAASTYTIDQNTRLVPSQGFGLLRFDDSTRRAPYVRLSYKSDVEKLKYLVMYRWGLRPPRVLISVTGGAKNFDLPPQLDKMLKAGLRRAAQASNAWFVTGGSNAGVMKYIGEALLSEEGRPLTTVIGVATWGILNGQDAMRGANGGYVDYGNPDSYPERSSSLDRNHTHFVLVDDGSVKKYGVEIELRARLERCLADQSSSGKFGSACPIATVCIVIQGGPGTLGTAVAAASQGTPLVIVEGSGQAADVIAYAYKLRYHQGGRQEYHDAGLRDLIQQSFGIDAEDVKRIDEIRETTMRCIECQERIFLYQVDLYGSHDQPLDVMILDAILKCSTQRQQQQSDSWLMARDVKDSQERVKRKAERFELDRSRRLEMALLWDRFDVANAEACKYRLLRRFTGEYKYDPVTESEVQMLIWSIQEGRLQFMKLFLEAMQEEDITALLLRKIKNPFQPNTDNDAAQGLGQSLVMPDYASVELPSHLKHELRRIANTMISAPAEVLRRGRKLLPKDQLHRANTLNVAREKAASKAKTWLKKLIIMGCNLQLGTAETVVPSTVDLDELKHVLALQAHEEWLHSARAEDWKYGAVLDHVKKTDPRIASYDRLTAEQKDEYRNDINQFIDVLTKRCHISIHAMDVMEFLFFQAQCSTDKSTSHVTKIFDTYNKMGNFSRPQIRRVLLDLLGSKYNSLMHVPAERSPYFDLLVWALIRNMPEFALYFWKQLPEHSIPVALLSPRMCQAIQEQFPHLDPIVLSSYASMEATFRGLANDILAACHKTDAEATSKLVGSVSSFSGDLPTWRLAYNINDLNFTSHAAVQDVVSQLWYGDLYQPGQAPSLLTMVLWSCVPWYRPSQPASIADVVSATPDKSWWQRSVDFYKVPAVSFYSEMIMYILFLLLYSSALMLPINDWSKLSVVEAGVSITAFAWVLTLIIDEFRQFASDPSNWWHSSWNRWDLLNYCVTAVGALLMLSSNAEAKRFSNSILAVTAQLYWLRFGQFYSVSKTLGPKLVMIKLMLGDILVFLAIILLLLIGYGVALYSLVYPTRPWDETSIAQMLYRPVFQLFGESFLEDLNTEAECEPQFHDCKGRHGWLMTFIIGLYMLFANILMVNLLIAMMSSTYERVAAESLQFWSRQNIDCLDEFSARSVPPPLNIFKNTWWFIKYFRGKIARNRVAPMIESSGVKPLPALDQPTTDRKALKFSREVTERFHQENEQKDRFLQIDKLVQDQTLDIGHIQRVLQQVQLSVQEIATAKK